MSAGAGQPLPLPPLEMRKLVGPTEDRFYDNPEGERVIDWVPAERYRSVLDFGCGCGRIARQLVQQRDRPERYLGVDLHRGMIRWCQENLAPRAPGFSFRHHDVHNPGFNPGPDKPSTAPLPAEDAAFTLAIAWSVFTHLVESQIDHYLWEIARVLEPDGALASTWFLFEREDFPTLSDRQHSLYINDVDPTNAVIYDRDWVRERARRAGLAITRASPPDIRGFHWWLELRPFEAGVPEIELPPDTAQLGRQPPPLSEVDVSQVGL